MAGLQAFRPTILLLLKRPLIFLHRWLGVALCLIFALWFSSGIGMMYWDFPAVAPADRLERSPALNPATIAVSPAEATWGPEAMWGPASTWGPALAGPTDIHLNTFERRPCYR